MTLVARVYRAIEKGTEFGNLKKGTLRFGVSVDFILRELWPKEDPTSVALRTAMRPRVLRSVKWLVDHKHVQRIGHRGPGWCLTMHGPGNAPLRDLAYQALMNLDRDPSAPSEDP